MNKKKITSKHYRKLLNVSLHGFNKKFLLYRYVIGRKDDPYKFCSRLYKILRTKDGKIWKEVF